MRDNAGAMILDGFGGKSMGLAVHQNVSQKFIIAIYVCFYILCVRHQLVNLSYTNIFHVGNFKAIESVKWTPELDQPCDFFPFFSRGL